MFCPKCAEQQLAEETQFCSKCGFPTRGVKMLLENDGKVEDGEHLSSKQKGIRQGAKLVLLSFILFPAFILLSALLPPDDVLVESSPSNTWFEQIGWAILWTSFLAGSARIAYAVFFESKISLTENFVEKTKQINASKNRNALPPSQTIPVSGFGKWKEKTGKIFVPLAEEKTSGELK